MATNLPSIENIRIDEENGELVGDDEDGYTVRVPRTDWSDRDQDQGNWLDLVEALATNLEINESEERDDIRLTLDIKKAVEKLSNNFGDFDTGEVGELQAKVVIDHLIKKNRLVGEDDEVVFYKDYHQFPEGLVNFAAYVSSIADEIEKTIGRMEEELTSLQQRRDEIEKQGPDEKEKISIDELAEDIREICGEFRFPKDYSRDGNKYTYDVTAPDDINDRNDREKFESVWAQILEREEMNRGDGYGLSPILVDELGKQIERDIDLLRRRVVELREAAQDARLGYLNIKDPEAPGDLEYSIDGALQHSNELKQIATQRREALDRDEIEEKYAKYKEAGVKEAGPAAERDTETDPVEEEFVLRPEGSDEVV